MLIWIILEKTTLYLSRSTKMSVKVEHKLKLINFQMLKVVQYTYKSSFMFTRTVPFLFFLKAFCIFSFSDFGKEIHLPCFVFHSQKDEFGLVFESVFQCPSEEDPFLVWIVRLSDHSFIWGFIFFCNVVTSFNLVFTFLSNIGVYGPCTVGGHFDCPISVYDT